MRNFVTAWLVWVSLIVPVIAGTGNLLQNPDFDFQSFTSHRYGKANSYESHNVAFWNTDAWGDIRVVRESHVEPGIRPLRSVHNLVSIEPGKRLYQFFTLSEAGLAPMEKLSLFAGGYQSVPGALEAVIKVMKLDSEPGTWSPSEFGSTDKRTFPKKSRGDMVVAAQYVKKNDAPGSIELEIDSAEIVGSLEPGKAEPDTLINTIGIMVEFVNKGSSEPVWVYSPCLTRSEKAVGGEMPKRKMEPYYTSIPRTIQRLWKGETLHVMIMGSSIDRGSANPRQMLFDEDPNSPKFKTPISHGDFDAKLINRPDLEGHFGWWNHYFSYGGQLKLELMRKFDLPAEKICLTFMACDGSCVGEAHSALPEYFNLTMPPSAGQTGHGNNTKWDELFPELFTRPQGPAPDLVIFGSGANEKTDTPEEVAVFEGMIRWIQRHSPHTEFLFCMFQNYGGYTPNAGDLMALALHYQIPYLDYGKVGDDAVRWIDRTTLVPSDGHPQSAAHYLWFKQVEKAFECWTPVLPGVTQLRLPERLHQNTYGWEGEMITFGKDDPRIQNARFILEDTVVNCWAKIDTNQQEQAFSAVDGVKQPSRQRTSAQRSTRNSTFRHGNCTLGDRHILEISGKESRLMAVDAKICQERRFFPVDHVLWQGNQPVTVFDSQWGAPYGSVQIVLKPGVSLEIEVVANAISVAFVDQPNGGKLAVSVNEVEKLEIAANQPYTDIEGKEHWMENRRGILNLGYGLHKVTLTAKEASVAVLGVYTYDTRANRSMERSSQGFAIAGETINFTLPYKTRPVVVCGGGLLVESGSITAASVTFSGEGKGWYSVTGE